MPESCEDEQCAERYGTMVLEYPAPVARELRAICGAAPTVADALTDARRSVGPSPTELRRPP